MDLLPYFLLPFTTPSLLLLVALGTLGGIIIGAIPGLSVTMGVALLLSLTFSWELYESIALMLGVYVGGVFGGSRSAILVNIPGSPAAVATSFDGYPMAQKGEAKLALTLTTLASFIGGIIGITVLAIGAPSVAKIALNFGQRDYLLLALLGLLLVGGLSKGSLEKGIFSASLGVIIGLIGIDPIGGAHRFTFGSFSLLNGVDFVVAILGLFGLAEILFQMRNLHQKAAFSSMKKVAFPTVAFLLKFLPLTLRVSVMGVLIGALPGAGGEIAALLGYDHAKQTFKNPNKPFGEGAHAGVIAPEAANNAAIGGALIPLLTLGIPGDAVTAIFIGALFVHGLQPGPLLMVQSGDLFWMMVGSAALANIFLLIFGLGIVRIFVRVITVPNQILLPIISVITVVGSYALNNSVMDVYWMLGFGFFGFLMKIYKFPVAPMVLGIILGPLVDSSFRRAYLASDGMGDFLLGFITTPITLILTLAFLLALFSHTQLLKLIWQVKSHDKTN